jgi:hypothetical protein
MFCKASFTTQTWPISLQNLRAFVNWALTKRKLNTSTVRVYLSDIKLAHHLRDVTPPNNNDFFVTSMLKGAENIALYSNIVRDSKLVMSYPLLKLLGHEIAKSNWSPTNKKVFWCACCLAFFGSFRMGEILCSDANSFSTENFTWKRINFAEESATINIRFPKINKDGNGDYIDIFKTRNTDFCPFTCLKVLSTIFPNNVSNNLPVFTFDSGNFLTVKIFSDTVKELLRPYLGPKSDLITGHSFRAGIPAAIANHPDLLSNDDVCKWGRWSSSSFKIYTRLKLSARESIFEKLLSAL